MITYDLCICVYICDIVGTLYMSKFYLVIISFYLEVNNISLDSMQSFLFLFLVLPACIP